MDFTLKIIDFNGECAVVFPDEMLKKLNVKEGDQIEVVESSTGLEIKPLNIEK